MGSRVCFDHEHLSLTRTLKLKAACDAGHCLPPAPRPLGRLAHTRLWSTLWSLPPPPSSRGTWPPPPSAKRLPPLSLTGAPPALPSRGAGQCLSPGLGPSNPGVSKLTLDDETLRLRGTHTPSALDFRGGNSVTYPPPTGEEHRPPWVPLRGSRASVAWRGQTGDPWKEPRAPTAPGHCGPLEARLVSTPQHPTCP